MRVVLLLAGLLMAGAASSFPYIPGNTPRQARTYCLCDTLNTPAGPSGRSRTIYLVAGTTVAIDSTLNTWRNGGAVPQFRRIQGLRIAQNDPSLTTGALAIVTVHRDGATSSMNRLFLWPAVWYSIPLEADSIVVKSATAAAASFTYCVW